MFESTTGLKPARGHEDQLGADAAPAAPAGSPERMASLGRLVAGIAHELNNPLTSILGHVQLMQFDAGENSQLRQDLLVVEQETQRCVRLIKSLLDYARDREPRVSVVDLTGVAQQMTALLSYGLRRAGVSVDCDWTEEPTDVRVDQRQLQELLIVLLESVAVGRGTKAALRLATRREAGGARLTIGLTAPRRDAGEPGLAPAFGGQRAARLAGALGAALAVEALPEGGTRCALTLPLAIGGTA